MKSLQIIRQLFQEFFSKNLHYFMIFNQIFQYSKILKNFVENYIIYNFLEKFLKQMSDDFEAII